MSRAGLVAFAVVTLTTCAASAERKTSPKSVKLFDVRTATHEGVLRFSTLSYRATDQARYEGGYEAAFLHAMTSRSGPFHLTGLSGPALRFLDEKSFSLSLPQNTAFGFPPAPARGRPPPKASPRSCPLSALATCAN